MNFKEKLTSYDRTAPRLHIFREGLFAKLYNESAYLFVRHVHAYKVNVMASKRGRYCSLGFPASRLRELLGGKPGWELCEVEDGYWTCSCPSAQFDETAYAAWRREAEEAARKAERRESPADPAPAAPAAGAACAAPAASAAPAPAVPAACVAPVAPVASAACAGAVVPAATPAGTAGEEVAPVAEVAGAGPVPAVADPLSALRPVLSEIRRFRIDSATPLECMLFLQSVQRKLYGAIPESAGL